MKKNEGRGRRESKEAKWKHDNPKGKAAWPWFGMAVRGGLPKPKLTKRT